MLAAGAILRYCSVQIKRNGCAWAKASTQCKVLCSCCALGAAMGLPGGIQRKIGGLQADKS